MPATERQKLRSRIETVRKNMPSPNRRTYLAIPAEEKGRSVQIDDAVLDSVWSDVEK